MLAVGLALNTTAINPIHGGDLAVVGVKPDPNPIP